MRLLMISVDALPKIGGVSLLAHYLANALIDAGAEVEFLGPAGTHCPAGFEPRYELVEDFAADASVRKGAAALEEDERIVRLLEEVATNRPFDRFLLIHPNYYGVAVADVAQQFGVPLSCFAHGFEVRSQTLHRADTDIASLAANANRRDGGERLLSVLGRADELLANSTYTAALLRSIGARSAVRAIGCGIDGAIIAREATSTAPADGSARRRRRSALGLAEDPLIVSCGRLVQHKRVDRIIDIVAAARRLQAVVIGDGPERLALEEHARVKGVADRIVFVGRANEAEKWRFHRAADFAALLSDVNDVHGQVEGFGIALLEGAVSGSVPVSSGTGGMVDVVTDGATGVIVPNDPNEAATRLEELYDRPDDMRQLAVAARRQVLDRYNYENIAAVLVEGWQSS